MEEVEDGKDRGSRLGDSRDLVVKNVLIEKGMEGGGGEGEELK